MKKCQSSKDVTVFSQLRKSVREPYMPKTQSPEASSRRNFENPIKWTVRYNCEILEIIKLERHFDNMCEIIDVHNFSLQTWPGAKNDEKKNGDSAPLLIDCFFGWENTDLHAFLHLTNGALALWFLRFRNSNGLFILSGY